MDNQTLKQLIADQGLNLYDTETVSDGERKIYRVYITSPEGISLDQCTKITKIISPILDLDPPINGEYTLEVSSPGIDRKLTKIDHYKSSINDLVKIKLLTGEKLKCKIISIESNAITFYDKGEKKEFTANFDDIIKAKTYFEW
jgi:ribosome maturation factor RimP